VRRTVRAGAEAGGNADDVHRADVDPVLVL
jgi:hypothetical protein